MLRSLRTLAPCLISGLVTAVLWLGASAPARADIPDDPPKKEEKTKEGSKDEAKSGGCSVATPNAGLAGLAGLVLVISATTLRRRSR